MVEWYEAFSDYIQQMERFETLVAGLSTEINGTTQISYRGRSLNRAPPWRRLSILDGLKDVAGIDIGQATLEDLPGIFRRHHPVGVDALPIPLTWGCAVVELFEAIVEPRLWNPVFVMDRPVEISPLTKKHRNDPRLVERFEPLIAGMEVGNSYSELNNTVEQYDRLIAQQVAREKAYDLDQDFLDAICHGMPPAVRYGAGRRSHRDDFERSRKHSRRNVFPVYWRVYERVCKRGVRYENLIRARRICAAKA